VLARSLSCSVADAAAAQPKATISTVSNVAAASMESALPTTRATATMLAPEEVFAPASADVRARSELTPGEKRATRNRSKKAHKKEHAQIDAAAVGAKAAAKGLKGVKKEKEEALKSIVKAGRGVTVVGKKNKEIADKVKGKRSK
jgi:U3 small nucleolar RNA-associated protein MPP10